MIKIQASARLVLVESGALEVTAAGGQSWFDSLSKEQKAQYLKLHPKSKYGKGSAPAAKPTPKTKKAPAKKPEPAPAPAPKPAAPASAPLSSGQKERAKRAISSISGKDCGYLVEDYDGLKKISEALKTAKGPQKTQLLKKQKDLSLGIRDQANAAGIDLRKNPGQLDEFMKMVQDRHQFIKEYNARRDAEDAAGA